jgi:hypothetical protein
MLVGMPAESKLRRVGRPLLRAGALASLLGLGLVACSKGDTSSRGPEALGPGGGESETQRDPLGLSRRVYELGEAAWSGGAKFEAVALWRQAFRTLPPDPEFDMLRHRMVMRIGHALIELHRLDGDVYHLQAGHEMVDRWIAARAGKDESSARDEAYELLGEFELRLEEPPPRSTADVEHERGEESRTRLLAGYDGASTALQTRDAHAGEKLGSEGVRREVEVETSAWARLDDPKVEAFLRHPGLLGPSLFDKGPDPFNPTRPLVRAGAPRIAGDGAAHWRVATRETWRIIREQRPALELCYASSMARAPTEVVRMQVTLEVSETGRVSATRTRGDILGDSIGDDCLRRAFERARVDSTSLQGERLAVIPLTFFIQPATYISPGPALPGRDGAPGINNAEGKYQRARAVEGDQGAARGRQGQ